MDIVRLQYFFEVCKYLNFSEASKHLYVSQSAISKQVALLEEELEVKLFLRNKRTVELTSAGTIFYERTKEIVEQYKEAIAATRKANKGILGTLKIGFVQYMEFLPKFLRMFQKNYPLIEIIPHQMNTDLLMSSINNKEIDLGFTFSFGIEKFPNLSWKTFIKGEMVVIANIDHHLSTQNEVHISSLEDEPFVIMSPSEAPGSYNRIVKLCKDEGFSPNITFQVNRIEALFLLVDSGFAISILPKGVRSLGDDNHKRIPIEGNNFSYDWGVLWHKDETNPALNIFLKELKNYVNNEEGLQQVSSETIF